MKKIFMAVLGAVLCYCSACTGKGCNDKNCKKPAEVNSTTALSTKLDTVELTCKLTNAEQMKRGEELKDILFSKYDKMNETNDALEFVYNDGKKYSPLLLDFIMTERECCPFFTFSMNFEPNSSKVSLSVGGSPRMKEMLKGYFSENK